MKRYPAVLHLSMLTDPARLAMRKINDKWVAARFDGYPSFWSRIKCAWTVFRGKGDVLIWPEGQ